MKNILLMLLPLLLIVNCSSDSNNNKSSSKSTSSYKSSPKQARFEGSYIGNNNYGLQSTINVRSSGKYTMRCPDMDSYINGKWEKESGSRISFYADNGFGGMDKTFAARVSTGGLQVDGGNFYRRK